MWEVVRYDNVDFTEDRRALEVILAAVQLEMVPTLTDKETAKGA